MALAAHTVSHEPSAFARSKQDVAQLLDELVRSHVRFPALFESNAEPKLLLDVAGNLVTANAAALKLLGREAPVLRGGRFARGFARHVGPHEREAFALALGGKTVRLATTIARRGSRRIALEATLFAAIIDGVVVGVYVCALDVTARLEREAATARRLTERIRELYLVAANPSHGSEAQLAMALDAGRKRLGCREAYVGRIDAGELTFVHCNGRSRHREGERRSLAGTLDERAMLAEEPVASPGGAESGALAAPIVVAGRPFGTVVFIGPRGGSFDADDIDYVRLIASLASASIDRGQQQRRLDALAFYDALTGLPNRVQLSDRLTATIAGAQHDRTSFALHFFDLDGFKAINDEHGHQRGDDVIALMGKRLERNVARPNFVARVGGDEFVVLQPAARTNEDARTFAQTLRAAIAEPFVVDRREYRLGASVGIAFYPGDGADAARLLERADLALYKVKATGRNAIAFAHDLE